MSTNFSARILGRDTHANRPTATSVPEGTRYSCSDHMIVYVARSGAWVNWLVLGTPVASGGGIPASQIKPGSGNAITGITLDFDPVDGSFIVVGLTFAGSGTGGASALSSTNTTWTKVHSATLSGVENEIWVGEVSTGGGKVISITESREFVSGTALEINSGMNPASIGVTLGTVGPSGTLSAVTVGNVVLIMACNSNTTVTTTVTALNPRGFGYYSGIVTLMAVTADDTDVAITASGNNILLMVELAAA